MDVRGGDREKGKEGDDAAGEEMQPKSEKGCRGGEARGPQGVAWRRRQNRVDGAGDSLKGEDAGMWPEGDGDRSEDGEH